MPLPSRKASRAEAKLTIPAVRAQLKAHTDAYIEDLGRRVFTRETKSAKEAKIALFQWLTGFDQLTSKEVQLRIQKIDEYLDGVKLAEEEVPAAEKPPLTADQQALLADALALSADQRAELAEEQAQLANEQALLAENGGDFHANEDKTDGSKIAVERAFYDENGNPIAALYDRAARSIDMSRSPLVFPSASRSVPKAFTFNKSGSISRIIQWILSGLGIKKNIHFEDTLTKVRATLEEIKLSLLKAESLGKVDEGLAKSESEVEVADPVLADVPEGYVERQIERELAHDKERGAEYRRIEGSDLYIANQVIAELMSKAEEHLPAHAFAVQGVLAYRMERQFGQAPVVVVSYEIRAFKDKHGLTRELVPSATDASSYSFKPIKEGFSSDAKCILKTELKMRLGAKDRHLRPEMIVVGSAKIEIAPELAGFIERDKERKPVVAGPYDPASMTSDDASDDASSEAASSLAADDATSIDTSVP